jgi:hypothetical protein
MTELNKKNKMMTEGKTENKINDMFKWMDEVNKKNIIIKSFSIDKNNHLNKIKRTHKYIKCPRCKKDKDTSYYTRFTNGKYKKICEPCLITIRRRRINQQGKAYPSDNSGDGPPPFAPPSNKSSIQLSADIPYNIWETIDSFLYRSRINAINKYNNAIIYDTNNPIISEEWDLSILNLIVSYAGDVDIEYRNKSKKGIKRLKSITNRCMYHNLPYRTNILNKINYMPFYGKSITNRASTSYYDMLKQVEPYNYDVEIIKNLYQRANQIDDMEIRDDLKQYINTVKNLANQRYPVNRRAIIIDRFKCCYNCHPNYWTRHDDKVIFVDGGNYQEGDDII